MQQLYESAKDDLTLQLNEAVQQRDAALADAARQAAKVQALQVMHILLTCASLTVGSSSHSNTCLPVKPLSWMLMLLI